VSQARALTAACSPILGVSLCLPHLLRPSTRMPKRCFRRVSNAERILTGKTEQRPHHSCVVNLQPNRNHASKSLLGFAHTQN